MSAAFLTPSNRNKTFILLAICVLLAIAAVVVGIDDNPPGILLALLSATAFVLAFVHPWRIAKKFIFLLLTSVLGFGLFIVLSIMLDSVTQDPSASGTLRELIESPAMNALNTIIIMLCSAAFIVGVVGSAAMFIRNRRRQA
jgi:hypothetical protein